LSKPVKSGVPKSLFVLIIVILASMFYYAAYRDYSNPEVVAKSFYSAYFKSDYDTMAQNLSVFWGVQFMPQYMIMSPDELIEKRPAIEASMTDFITRMESENKVPANMSIKILPKYTQRADNTALVVYEFREKNKSMAMEMALMVKENNRMRIFQMMPADQAQLDQLTGHDIAAIEESFKEMLGQ
jgi:predicted GIY-YIG superfamily endonuclease